MSDFFMIGVAERGDQGLLYDIDLKCFEDVWSHEYWPFWFGDSNVIFLVKESGKNGSPVGMAVCVCNQDGIVIEKLCVKKQYRRQGVSRMLLRAAHGMAAQYEKEVPVYLAIPEVWLGRGYDDHEFGLGDWTRALNMTATRGILTDYFFIQGHSEDGIRFISEVKRSQVPLCWSCSSRVQYLDDGWVCTECNQHGAPDRIVSDWEEARRTNSPYMGDCQ